MLGAGCDWPGAGRNIKRRRRTKENERICERIISQDFEGLCTMGTYAVSVSRDGELG